jgi:nitronate monooxygenase
VANFVEVFLAKEGHPGVVGLNLLEKIQFPNLPSLYGAMLAGVNAVLVSAGIPRAVPGVLDHFAAGRGAEPVLDATDADPTAPVKLRFESADYFATPARELKRPQFLAIVSSATLAIMLAKKSAGRFEGFIVEGGMAGGHNASPCGSRAPGPGGRTSRHRVRILRRVWTRSRVESPGVRAQSRKCGARFHRSTGFADGVSV